MDKIKKKIDEEWKKRKSSEESHSGDSWEKWFKENGVGSEW
jgi:hypothetical protein